MVRIEYPEILPLFGRDPTPYLFIKPWVEAVDEAEGDALATYQARKRKREDKGETVTCTCATGNLDDCAYHGTRTPRDYRPQPTDWFPQER